MSKNFNIEDIPPFLREPAIKYGQKKTHSVLESVTNVLIGYGIAIVSQVVIFPMYNIHIPISQNLEIGAWFTVISLIRSYVLRRWFNKITITRNY